MTEAFKREKVFRDPVHDYIHVQHPIILELINSRELQRLRRIKQTGASMYTFHTAEHSDSRILLECMKSLDAFAIILPEITLLKKKEMAFGTIVIAS